MLPLAVFFSFVRPLLPPQAERLIAGFAKNPLLRVIRLLFYPKNDFP